MTQASEAVSLRQGAAQFHCVIYLGYSQPVNTHVFEGRPEILVELTHRMYGLTF